MADEYPPVYEPIIPTPLWDLMLSTNDCHPGCGCDLDYFQITEERIGEWMNKHPTKIKMVLEQLDELEEQEDLDLDSLVVQTAVNFRDREEVKTWVNEWKTVISSQLK